MVQLDAMTADELKEWRLSRGWKQTEAARKLGVSRSTYRRAETDGPRALVELRRERLGERE